MTPQTVVSHILQTDAFSNWLGIKVISLEEGTSKIEMTVRAEMMNGLGIVHGGIAFAFADSAFAFACNNRNNLSVALDNAINYLKPIYTGDVITAVATEIHNGKSTGLYQVTITNQHQQVVAIFKGTCFRTGKPVVK